MNTTTPCLKNLPLGISDFEKIINGQLVYIDKTELIYQLVTSGQYYFLSRPRRFGKSLLVSTLDALFSGKKELFENLWIGKSDWAWQTHPVIRFDFSSIGNRTIADFIANINNCLDTIAHEHTLDVTNCPTIDSKFKTLITNLAKKNKVVILIDEYDKPILDHIDNLEEAKAQREVLKSLYSVIKGADQYLRFVLLTGVSKFAKTSIFSGINNLKDISMDMRYAIMLGYTHKEVQTYFHAHLDQLAKKQKISYEDSIQRLTDYYDGYQFAAGATRVFNPYSVLLCCDKETFGNYWFATGTPTFLLHLLKKHNDDLKSIMQPTLNEESLESFEPEDIDLPALLFQTGYLTIKSYDPKTNNYTLGTPNREVYNGLTINLVRTFTRLPANQSLQYAQRITHTLVEHDMLNFHKVLQEFFNHMPYTVHIKSEQYLEFVLYSIFALIGVTVDPEVTTSIGRADLVVSFPKLVYVIELKFNKPAQEALEQIQDRRYYEKYENTGKKIILVGIAFEEKTKIVTVATSCMATQQP